MWQAHHLDRLPLLRHLQEDDDGGYVISSKSLLNYLLFRNHRDVSISLVWSSARKLLGRKKGDNEANKQGNLGQCDLS